MINTTTVNKPSIMNNSTTRINNRRQHVNRIRKNSVKNIAAIDKKFNIPTLSDLDEQYVKPLISIFPIYHQINNDDTSNVLSSSSLILNSNPFRRITFIHNIRPETKNIESSSNNDNINASDDVFDIKSSKNTPIYFTSQLNIPNSQSSSWPISLIDFVSASHVITNRKHLLMPIVRIVTASANKGTPPIKTNYFNINTNEHQKKNVGNTWMKKKYFIHNPVKLVNDSNQDLFKYKLDTNRKANFIFDVSKIKYDESEHEDKRMPNNFRWPALSDLHFKSWGSNNEHVEPASKPLTNMTVESNFPATFFPKLYIAVAICGFLLVVRLWIWWKRVLRKKKENIATISGSSLISKQYSQLII